MNGLAIRAEGLTKRYGDVPAVDGLNLSIPAGSFFGLLGPNGAGKTTTIHMLSTLIRPSAGEAWVAGHSVRTESLAVRSSIGVVFQENALDHRLTVAENLRFAGRLNGLSSREIRQRSDELLELFGLAGHRDRPVAALSGGMRRALDIARGMIHRPRVLFLDEPTIGLDLPARRAIWRHIGRLRASLGITVFLSTHYLEEATDCDEVAFLSNGRIVERGAPGPLIAQLGRCIVEIETDRPAELAKRLEPRLGPVLVEADRVHLRCEDEPGALLQAELASLGSAMRWRRPNLNDVFLWVNRAQTDRRQAA
ncbi:MAG: ATP-binding cassette domain-containing protein [Pseudomonadota bacterium]|jgi:ABC-type multidrug transport system, ATPase component|nr:MAG: ABC transporter ATP-binding protein [Pseudomonadota bacterium]